MRRSAESKKVNEKLAADDRSTGSIMSELDAQAASAAGVCSVTVDDSRSARRWRPTPRARSCRRVVRKRSQYLGRPSCRNSSSPTRCSSVSRRHRCYERSAGDGADQSAVRVAETDPSATTRRRSCRRQRETDGDVHRGSGRRQARCDRAVSEPVPRYWFADEPALQAVFEQRARVRARACCRSDGARRHRRNIRNPVEQLQHVTVADAAQDR